MDPVKIAGVAEWPNQATRGVSPSGLHQFLRRFIQGFSDLACQCRPHTEGLRMAWGKWRNQHLRPSDRVISLRFWCSQMRPERSELKLTAPTSPLEQSSRNSLRRTTSASGCLLFKVSMLWSRTTRSTTRKCWHHASSGGTGCHFPGRCPPQG